MHISFFLLKQIFTR